MKKAGSYVFERPVNRQIGRNEYATFWTEMPSVLFGSARFQNGRWVFCGFWAFAVVALHGLWSGRDFAAVDIEEG